jgi:DNA-binding transcriptional ArsR family regulator
VPVPDVAPERVPPWTFLTNHAHVLLCITRQPDIRLAEIARAVGIGERAVHRIVQDLVDAGYVARRKVGRRNEYEVHLDRPLRHPLEASHRIAEIFDPLAPVEATAAAAPARRRR